MAPQSNTLAWKIPWTEEPGRLWSMWSLRVRHYWVISLSLFTNQKLFKDCLWTLENLKIWLSFYCYIRRQLSYNVIWYKEIYYILCISPSQLYYLKRFVWRKLYDIQNSLYFILVPCQQLMKWEVLFYLFYFFGCSGSSLLHTPFLQLRWVRTTLWSTVL